MGWQTFATSVRGTSHTAGGLPCQDASAFRVADDWLIAMVCDGAGSAASSHVGSTWVTQHATADLAAAAEHFDTLDEAAFGTLVDTVLQRVRDDLARHAEAAKAPLYAYSSTVVGLVMGPTHGWFFHVGDGVGVIRHDGEEATLSLPENGEYANETFFLTGSHWRDHLRITPVTKPARSVWLMSDGTMPFAMNKGNSGLSPAFADPVERFLRQADIDTGNAGLQSTLDDPRTHAITGDDKTLLVGLNA